MQLRLGIALSIEYRGYKLPNLNLLLLFCVLHAVSVGLLQILGGETSHQPWNRWALRELQRCWVQLRKTRSITAFTSFGSSGDFDSRNEQAATKTKTTPRHSHAQKGRRNQTVTRTATLHHTQPPPSHPATVKEPYS